MAGIVSFGAHIPKYCLSRELLRQVWGGGGKGEKAIANFDEDSLTMAVEAGRDCIKGMQKDMVDKKLGELLSGDLIRIKQILKQIFKL